MTTIYGFYDSPDAADPAFDPGVGVSCPFCLKPLSAPMKTTSFAAPNQDKSFFYRAHRDCIERASEDAKTQVEGAAMWPEQKN